MFKFAFDVFRITTTPGLLKPYVVRHFRPRVHSCRCSLKLTMTLHNEVHTRFHAYAMHAKIQHAFITLIKIRRMSFNIESVHHFLQFSSFAIFSTENQVSPISDTTHFQFPNSTFHFSLVPRASVCAGYKNLTFLTTNFNSWLQPWSFSFCHFFWNASQRTSVLWFSYF